MAGGRGGATFVIKQKKLLPDVNIGDLIETDTGAVENWTVNHCGPAWLTVGEAHTDIDRYLFIYFCLLL